MLGRWISFSLCDSCIPYYDILVIPISSLQILQNDISAHGSSVESVNDAGREVISSEGGAEATVTRNKLDAMNQAWDRVLAKTRDRQLELEGSHKEAKSFHDELQDTLSRLAEIDGQLITAKPIGGLPETAKEQQEKFAVSRQSL